MASVTADRVSWPARLSALKYTLGLPALLVAGFLTVINPIGYVGGGYDDFHYLQAARCIAQHGWCLPTEHWARRFPLVVPVGLTIRLLGESRQALWIIPALYAAAAIILLAKLVAIAFGRRAAVLASLMLVATPLFADGTLALGVDIAELALFLAGLLFAFRGQPLPAGVFFALAVQCRPTMLATAPLFLWVYRDEWRNGIQFLAGFLGPLAVETLVYWRAAGDPLLTWKLSLAHTTLPSSELQDVDRRRLPILNMDFVKAWRPAAGLAAPWPIRGFVNFVAHPELIVLNLTCGALLGLNLKSVDRRLWLLLGGSLLLFVTLVFVFAIDPTPRMFMPIVVSECAVVGVLAARSWERRRTTIIALFSVSFLFAIAMAFARPDFRASSVTAAHMLNADRGLTVQPIYSERLALLGSRWNLYNGGHARVLTLERQSDCAPTIRWWAKRWKIERQIRLGRNILCVADV